MRFIPVNLCRAYVLVRQTNRRGAFLLSPALAAVLSLQGRQFADGQVNRDDFDLGDGADNLEIHIGKFIGSSDDVQDKGAAGGDVSDAHGFQALAASNFFTVGGARPTTTKRSAG